MANRRFIDFPIASTVGDNDIILIWQDGLNKQTTKATILTGISQDLASLTDVDLTGLTNGQILRYNSVTSKWENTDQGNLDLNDLNDVTIVSPSNGQVLVYNSSTSKWENSSGGYVPYIGAVTTVDLGAQQLKAGHTTLTTNGSTETLTINHTSGSGKAINVTKGGAGEGLYVNKTSGSGNAATIVGTLEATTLVKTGGISAQFLKADGSVDSTTYQSTADKGQPNGYASLDGNGKVPLTQINDALIGNVNFQGLWNASTNTPTLVDPPSSGTKGYYYIVSTGGTFAGITFEVGDWIISNGTAWGKVDNTDAVSSVFGRTGNVTASNGDYNTSQVTESGNLYYTEARVSANTDVAANTAARHNAVTLGTANGLSLSTQILSLGLASAGVTGALSGTDWSTFNSKVSSQWITTGSDIYYNTGGVLIGATNPDIGGSVKGTIIRQNGTMVVGFNDVSPLNYQSPIAADRMNTAGDGLMYGMWRQGFFQAGIGATNTQIMTFITGDGGNANQTIQMRIFPNGHVVINNTDDNGNRLRVNGTGFFDSTVTATQFIRSGGTSAQFLKADGSIDSNTYLTGNQTITLSGDATGSGTTAITVTLANSGVTAGTYNNVATQVRPFTVDAKGRITSIGTAVTITPAFSNITGKPTTLAGYGITDAVPSSRTITINGTTQDLSANRTFNVGTVTSITATAGTGISISGSPITSSGTLTITNTAPDQIVSLTASTGISISGTYPNFTITNTSPSSGGTVTSVSASSPLFSSGGTTPNITIQQASGSQSGFLSSTDWNTFNNKTSNVGTVTSVAALTLGTSGTDLSSSVANSTTTPVITLNVPTASAANRGALSAADWTTFNSKQNALTNPVTGTGTTNYLPKFTGSTTIGNSLVFDNGTNVGIGTPIPDAKLDIIGPSAASSPYLSKAIQFAPSNFPTRTWSLNYDDGGTAGYGFNISAASTRILYLNANGTVGIGTATSAGYKLDVNGNGDNVYIRANTSGTSNWSTLLLQNGDGSWHVTNDNTGTFNIGTSNDPSTQQKLTIASTGAATFGSSVTATSFFESSDASLKTLVEDNYQAKGIDSVVAKLYIKNGKEELGYYAQDLQGVLPSAVSKGSDGLLNLSYREVHTAKIAYLEEKIKQLENELGRISK